jgi:hypothetical protein
MNFVKANWKQLTIALLSGLCAAALIYRPAWYPYVVIAGSTLALIGLHLDPIAYGAKGPPPLPLLFLFAVSCTPAAQSAIADGIKLVQCIDDHINEPPEQIVVDCAAYGAKEATDIVGIVEGRKSLKRKYMSECGTTFMVDAGPQGDGGGPGK